MGIWVNSYQFFFLGNIMIDWKINYTISFAKYVLEMNNIFDQVEKEFNKTFKEHSLNKMLKFHLFKFINPPIKEINGKNIIDIDKLTGTYGYLNLFFTTVKYLLHYKKFKEILDGKEQILLELILKSCHEFAYIISYNPNKINSLNFPKHRDLVSSFFESLFNLNNDLISINLPSSGDGMFFQKITEKNMHLEQYTNVYLIELKTGKSGRTNLLKEFKEDPQLSFKTSHIPFIPTTFRPSKPSGAFLSNLTSSPTSFTFKIRNNPNITPPTNFSNNLVYKNYNKKDNNLLINIDENEIRKIFFNYYNIFLIKVMPQKLNANDFTNNIVKIILNKKEITQQ